MRFDRRLRLGLGSLAFCALLGVCDLAACGYEFGPGDVSVDAQVLCSNDPPGSTQTCVAGATAMCVCRDGTERTMTCGQDGLFGPCPCGSGDGGVPDAGPPVLRDAPAPDPRTYDFVIHRYAFDEGAEPPGNRGYYGFNLDGRFSPSTTAQQGAYDCSHGDHFSTVDPDQNMGTCTDRMPGGGAGCRGGVDNQYPNLAQTLQQFQPSFTPQSCFDQRPEAGRGLILLRVGGVDGPLGPELDDPEVTVRIYPDALPLFADCAGVTRPGQPYAVDDLYLTAAGDLDAARIRLTGSIVRGRLRVVAPHTDVLPFALGLGGVSRLRAFQLRVSLSETAGTRGNLGGYVDQTELAEQLVRSIFRGSWFRDALPPLIQGMVDLATPTGDGGASCDNPQGGIGIGVGFEAMRAVITATTSGPVPGMCGGEAATSTP